MVLVTALCKSMLGDSRSLHKKYFLRWQCCYVWPGFTQNTSQVGVSIPSFMTESRWLIPADPIDWWQCVDSTFVKVDTPALPWWNWDGNSNRKVWPVLLSTWIALKILAIGVSRTYWHVSWVAQPLANWLELTWPAARHSPSSFAAQDLSCNCVA